MGELATLVDVGLEESLLGLLILHPERLDDVVREQVGAEDFHRFAHRDVWRALLRLDSEGQGIDPHVVAHAVRGVVDDADELVVSLMAAASGAGSPVTEARLVRDLGRQRRLAEAAAGLAAAAREPTLDVDTLLDQAVSDLMAVVESESVRSPALLGELLDAHPDVLRGRGRGEGAAIPTGWADLDRLIEGLWPSQVVVVAGRPAMGKSQVAAQMALGAAKAGRPAVVVSLEMSSEEIMDRLVATEAEVSLKAMRTGRMREDDKQRVMRAVGELHDLPLAVIDQPGATLAGIRSSARWAKRMFGEVAVVVVDYLQLVTPPYVRRDNRQAEVADVSRGLKLLAMDMGCSVVAAAQLNRLSEGRRDKRPLLSDLRESGAIENDADVVIGLYREDYYERGSQDAGVLEAIVLKQRNGPTETARLSFNAVCGRVANLAPAGRGF